MIQHVFTSADGLRLRAVEHPGVDGAPVLLCLPGLTRNGRDFARLAALLAPGYRVLCPDQRGRGFASSILAALEELQSERQPAGAS